MTFFDIIHLMCILDKYNITSWEELDEKLEGLNKKDILRELKRKLR